MFIAVQHSWTLYEDLFCHYIGYVQDTHLPKSKLQLKLDSDDGSFNSNDDSLEDLMYFTVTLSRSNMSFGTKFWAEAADGGVTNRTLSEFLRKCLHSTAQDQSLFVPYIKMLTGISTGCDASSEDAYHFVKQSPSRLSWDHFFLSLQKYPELFQAYVPKGYSNFNTMGSFHHAQQYPAATTDQSGQQAALHVIRPEEVSALEAILDLIQSISSVSSLRILFHDNQQWAVMSTLFDLLKCPIPSRLKGSLMKTIAIFARSAEIASQIWHQLENAQILNTCAAPESSIPASLSHQQQYSLPVPTVTNGPGSSYGIKYELEQNESLNRRYPATIGFLSLIHELLVKNEVCPADLGMGSRVPGISPYLNYIINQVFLKFNNRQYVEEDEKWRVAAACLSLFRSLLHNYVIANEDFEDGWVEVPIQNTGHHPSGMMGSSNKVQYLPKPKAVGYQLMSQLLSDSDLFRKIIDILSFNGGVVSLEECHSQYLSQNIVNSLLFKKVQQHQNGTSPSSYQHQSAASPDSRKRTLDSLQYRNAAISPLRCTSSIHSIREQCIFLGLDILQIVSQKEDRFIQMSRHYGSTSIQVESVNTILLRSTPQNLINLCSYIRYTQLPSIALLSSQLLLNFSRKISPSTLYSVFQDSGQGAIIVEGYVSCLKTIEMDQANDGAQYNSLLSTPLFLYELSAKSLVGRTKAQNDGGKNSIRHVMMNLFHENLEKPSPNIAHLLLGFPPPLNSTGGSLNVDDILHYANEGCIGAIFDLLSTEQFLLTCPSLAESCHHLIYQLLSHKDTTQWVLHLLDESMFDFYFHQIQILHLLSDNDCQHQSAIALTYIHSWILRGLSLELHLCVSRSPTQSHRVRRLTERLLDSHALKHNQLQAVNRQLTSQSSTAAIATTSTTKQWVLWSVFDRISLSFSSPSYPTIFQSFPQLLPLIEACTEQQMDDYSSNKYLIIRTSKLMQCLSNEYSGIERQQMEDILKWALDWNNYSHSIASESNLLSGWSTLAQILLFESLPLVDQMNWQTSTQSSSSIELVLDVIEKILLKVSRNDPEQVKISELMGICCNTILNLICQLRVQDENADASFQVSSSQCERIIAMILQVIPMPMKTIGNHSPAPHHARCSLYAGLLNLFQFLRTTNSAEDTLFARETSVEAKSHQFEHERFFSCVQTFQHYLNCEIIEFVCNDMCDNFSRVMTFSFLELLLEMSQQKVLRVVCTSKFMQSFFQAFTDFSSTVPSPPTFQFTFSSAEYQATMAIFESTMSLFIQMALSSTAGAQALLDFGLVSHILNFKFFQSFRRGHGYGSISFGSDGIRQIRQEQQFHRLWSLMLHLIQTLLMALPNNKKLMGGVAEFCDGHHKLISTSFKECLDSRLELSLALVKEISTIILILGQLLPPKEDNYPTDSTAPKWSSSRYQKYLGFVMDVLQEFGHCVPVPNQNAGSTTTETPNQNLFIYNQHSEASKKSWWNRLNPITSTEQAQHERCSVAASSSQISIFEMEKMNLARLILCHSSMFCRRYMSTAPTAATAPIPSESKHPPRMQVILQLCASSSLPKNHHHNASESSIERSFEMKDWIHLLSTFVQSLSARSDEKENTDIGHQQQQQLMMEICDEQKQQQPHQESMFSSTSLESIAISAAQHERSMMFVIENMVCILSEHLLHYQEQKNPYFDTMLSTFRQDLLDCIGFMLDDPIQRKPRATNAVTKSWLCELARNLRRHTHHHHQSIMNRVECP